MKILINTSNLFVGGAVQVAVSFLSEINDERYQDIEFVVILSRSVGAQISKADFMSNFTFYDFELSPARLITRYKAHSILNSIIDIHNPNVVFTVFGPSYWKPKSLHTVGFAVPWVLEPDSIAFEKLNLLSKMKMKLWCYYVLLYLKKDSDSFIIETISGKDKLLKVLSNKKIDVSVIGNCCSKLFFNKNLISPNNPNFVKLPERVEGEFRFVFISYFHPHKNIEIIRDVLPYLKGYNVKFYLTLTEDTVPSCFLDNPNIVNLGPVTSSNCPSIYSQCDALFHPSLLEVFSASYPEAMASNIPILASDCDFAHDVCGEAALYFDPCSPKDIADKIKLLISNKGLQDKLTSHGSVRLVELENAESRANKYINTLKEIVFKHDYK